MQIIRYLILIFFLVSCAAPAKKSKKQGGAVDHKKPPVVQQQDGASTPEGIASSALREEAASWKDADPEKAQTLLREAIAINPQDQDALIDLAEVSCFLGDKVEMEGYLERAESLVGDDDARKEKISSLKSRPCEGWLAR